MPVLRDCSCCCPCFVEGEGCPGCLTTPETYRITFSGGTMVTSCLSCCYLGSCQSAKINSGTLAASTFDVAYDFACYWTYEATSYTGILSQQWLDIGTCVADVCVLPCSAGTSHTSDKILVSLTGTSDTLMHLNIVLFDVSASIHHQLFDADVVIPTSGGCCQTLYATDTNTSACGNFILGYGATATITPCPT